MKWRSALRKGQHKARQQQPSERSCSRRASQRNNIGSGVQIHHDKIEVELHCVSSASSTPAAASTTRRAAGWVITENSHTPHHERQSSLVTGKTCLVALWEHFLAGVAAACRLFVGLFSSGTATAARKEWRGERQRTVREILTFRPPCFADIIEHIWAEATWEEDKPTSRPVVKRQP